jgi:hypothetical protein
MGVFVPNMPLDIHPAAAPVGLRAACLIAGLVLATACVPTPAGRATAPPPSTPSATIVATTPPTPSPTGPTPTPSFVRPTPLPEPTFLAYVVKTGDTLTSIARTFSTTPLSIAYWNRASYPSLDPDSPGYAPDRIAIGWTLLLVPDRILDGSDLPESLETAEPSDGVDPGGAPASPPS